MDEVQVVQGPVAPVVGAGTIYQVTLASGMVVTSPAGFGPEGGATSTPEVVVTADGRVLIRPSVRG